MELLSTLTYFAMAGVTVGIYLIGFGIGRRSAYKDVDANFTNVSQQESNKKRNWNTATHGLIQSKTTK